MIAMAAVMLAGLASCKDDAGGNVGGEDDNAAKVHLSISLNIPNGSSMARTTEDSGIKETGIPAEYDIQNVTLYFFSISTVSPTTDYDYAGKYLQRLYIPSGNLGSPTLQSGDIYQYIATGAQTVTGLQPGGNYHVYAVVNGTTDLLLTNATTERQFLDNSRVTGQYNTTGLVSVAAQTNGWLMSSRGKGTWNSKTEAFNTLNIAANNDATNYATTGSVQLNVERVMGKLTITADASNTYDIETVDGTKYAKAELTNVKVMNLRRDGYLFRHMTSIPAADTDASFATAIDGFKPLTNPTYTGNVITSDADYIIDPQTKNKTLANLAISATMANWYTPLSEAVGTWGVAMPAVTTTENLGYCLENTMHSTMQLNGFSTGLMFKAKITPEMIIVSSGSSNNAATPYTPVASTYPTFYNYGDQFYNDIQALENAGIPLNSAVTNEAAFTGTPTQKEAALADLKSCGVTRCDNGVCYYYYWIKHEDNAQYMAVMEYAIVRNNVYKMKVTGISGVGESSEIIDPEEEDELTRVYLKVEMNILPWIVRENNNITL